MGVILMLPLIGVLVSVLEKLLRDKVEPEHTTRVLFINEAALQLPDTAWKSSTRNPAPLLQRLRDTGARPEPETQRHHFRG